MGCGRGSGSSVTPHGICDVKHPAELVPVRIGARGPRPARTGWVDGDEPEGAGVPLTNLRGRQPGRERARIRSQLILLVGLEDLEPLRRLGRALYDPEPRCGVEKSCLEHCGLPPLTRFLIRTVREDDVRAGKRAMGAWRLQ